MIMIEAKMPFSGHRLSAASVSSFEMPRGKVARSASIPASSAPCASHRSEQRTATAPSLRPASSTRLCAASLGALCRRAAAVTGTVM